MKKINFLLIILFVPFVFFGQSNDSISIKKILDEVSVNAIRAKTNTPIAFTNLNKQQIEKSNLGQDLPFLISSTPSVVTTSDAGAGIGYTGFRIRGTDPSRINVTINGIPLNDSESQGVWWVNMPDFASSIENIQIQRGVGTSTNGAAAFGASINLQTIGLNTKAYAITNNSVGSYNTLKNNIEFGSGLIDNKFTFDARLSRISSDGYIDRATSDLKSLYVQGTYFDDKSTLKGIIFSGNERTYQAWNGVPLIYLDSNRTFNSYTYENEVDNYAQTHYQLHYSKNLNQKTILNIAGHFTHGEGYYEQEKLDQDLLDYNLSNIILTNDTITSTDLIRRKWLNNDFGGITFSVKHVKENLNLIFGGAANKYSGQHYGNIIWAEYASNGDYNHEYYRNIATKYDNNIYLKSNYKASNNTSVFLDLQLRSLNYEFNGNDISGDIDRQRVNLEFFNPKFGLSHYLNKNQLFYASYAVANKEPNRADYVESSPNSRPVHETLFDTEIGYKYQDKWLMFNLNFYNMNYENQLIKTGEINDVGYFTSKNVKNSFRKGVEIESSYILNNKLSLSGNLTISENKLDTLVQYVDNWDTGDQNQVVHENTDLAFSPNLTWAANINYKYNKNTNFLLNTKYVGDQYIDNTSSEKRMLESYLVSNFQIDYHFKSSIFTKAKISFLVNNLFDIEYVNNAWIYRYISDSSDPREYDDYTTQGDGNIYDMAGYFPQATRNYLLGLTLGF
ncbi:MAG: TonB-dependent receptor [Flavobacteriales bacterium]|nr:TonB-dependent receptor [Flavobacteriales bacterium]